MCCYSLVKKWKPDVALESTGEQRPMHAVEMGHSCCTARQPQESGCGLKRNSPPPRRGTTFALALQDATLTTTRLFLSCCCSHASTCSLPGGMDGDIRSALPEALSISQGGHAHAPPSSSRLPPSPDYQIHCHTVWLLSIPSSTSENPSCPPGSFSDLVCFFAS